MIIFYNLHTNHAKYIIILNAQARILAKDLLVSCVLEYGYDYIGPTAVLSKTSNRQNDTNMVNIRVETSFINHVYKNETSILNK